MFAVNSVFAVVADRYLDLRRKFEDSYIAKIREHNAGFHVEGKEKFYRRFLFKASKGYRYMRSGFYACLSLATTAIFCSLYYLIKAAIVPRTPIDIPWLIFMSMTLLIVFPSIYFLYHRLSEWVVSKTPENLDLTKEDVSAIEISIEMEKFGEMMDQMSGKMEVYVFKSRAIMFLDGIIKIITSIFHPVRYFMDKRVTDRYNDSKSNGNDSDR